MPPKKRTTTKATATKRTTKRTITKHIANTNNPPSTRLTKRSPAPTPPKAALRPAGKDARRLRPPSPPLPTHEVIELSSTSPTPLRNAAFDIHPYTDVENELCNGILPTDSTQDIIINSVEELTIDIVPPFPPPGFPPTAFPPKAFPAGHNPLPDAPLKGVAHYLSLTANHPHTTISTSFDAYVGTPPSNIALRPRMPTPAEQVLNLGPSAQGVDYWVVPRRDTAFRAPIYAGVTTNPLIPFAVLKLVERNVPFVEWGGERGVVPNAGGGHLRFPREVERGEAVWLEGFEGRVGGTGTATGTGDAAKDTITVLFLPRFFLDGRHALLYFTRKSVSGRFAALICAPCTTGELGRLGLLQRVGPGDANYESFHNVPVSNAANQVFDETDIGWGEPYPIQWGDMMVAVGNGRWIERREERQMWGEAMDVVGREWGIRMGLCIRALAEGGVEARGRDGGTWGMSGVD